MFVAFKNYVAKVVNLTIQFTAGLNAIEIRR